MNDKNELTRRVLSFLQPIDYFSLLSVEMEMRRILIQFVRGFFVCIHWVVALTDDPFFASFFLPRALIPYGGQIKDQHTPATYVLLGHCSALLFSLWCYRLLFRVARHND
uniref:Uncharacterized protein n=1 Tax=Caenorhabditis japonica TaxID=281687 RepID=A0A8R1EW11_CAEJA